MFEKTPCPACGRELTGVIISTFGMDGAFVVVVSEESSDCNWTRCKGCGKVLCQQCYRDIPWYCCDEDRIVARERAQASQNGHGSFSRLMARSSDAIRRLNAILAKPKFPDHKDKKEE